MASENLARVKKAWQRLERDGHARGMDALFEHCHPDCVFRPAASRGEVLHGVETARAFFREQRNAGGDINVSAYSFREKGDSIEVLGWIRLIRPEGGMADSQGRWVYRFSDGQIVEADYSPATVATAGRAPARRA
jgi:ketosteroid isomerase-like protein